MLFSLEYFKKRNGNRVFFNCLLGGALGAIIFLFASCCFLKKTLLHEECGPFSYESVSSLCYIGGSLLFDVFSPKINQIAVGSIIPIRFGKLSKRPIPVGSLPASLRSKGETFYEYSDEEPTSQYGLMEILSANAKCVVMRVKLFDHRGRIASDKIDSLYYAHTLDLNSDSKPDIAFTDSISAARKRSLGKTYLTFISSKDEGVTTMFSYVPELVPGLNKAGGNMGYNSNGNAIVKLNAATTKSLESGLSLEPGDFVIDVNEGNYKRLASGVMGPAPGAGVPYPTRQVLRSASPVKSFGDVFPLLYLNLNKGNSGCCSGGERLAAGAGTNAVITDNAEYAARLARYRDQLNGYKIHFEVPSRILPLDKLRECKDGGCIGLINGSVHIGLDGKLAITYKSVSSTIAGMFMFDGYIGASCAKELNLQINKELYSSYWGSSAIIGYVILDYGVRPAIGYSANLSFGPETKMGIYTCAVFGGRVKVDASFTDFNVSPDKFKDLFICPDFALKTALGMSCYLYPYVELAPEVHVEELVDVKFPARVSLGPYWDVKLTKNDISINNGIKLVFTESVVAGAKVGVDYWWCPGCYKEWDPINYTIYKFEDTLWHKDYTLSLINPDNLKKISVAYPLPDCAPGMVRTETGSCIPVCPPGTIRNENGACIDTTRPTTSITMDIKLVAHPGSLKQIKWKGLLVSSSGGFAGDSAFDTTAYYSLCHKEGCVLNHVPGCCELAETFHNLMPGTWSLEIWSGYDLLGAMQVNLVNNVCLITKFPENTSYEHHCEAIPITELKKSCTGCQ